MLRVSRGIAVPKNMQTKERARNARPGRTLPAPPLICMSNTIIARFICPHPGQCDTSARGTERDSAADPNTCYILALRPNDTPMKLLLHRGLRFLHLAGLLRPARTLQISELSAPAVAARLCILLVAAQQHAAARQLCASCGVCCELPAQRSLDMRRLMLKMAASLCRHDAARLLGCATASKRG